MLVSGYQLEITPALFKYERYNSRTKRTIEYKKLNHVISKRQLRKENYGLIDEELGK